MNYLPQWTRRVVMEGTGRDPLGLSRFPAAYTEIPKTVKEHLFTEPTFMPTGNPRFPTIKLLGIRATI